MIAYSWFYYKKFTTLHGHMNVKERQIHNSILSLVLIPRPPKGVQHITPAIGLPSAVMLPPTSKLPYNTPLQLSSHAIHINTGTDNHTKPSLATSTLCWLTQTRGSQKVIKQEAEIRHQPKQPRDFFQWT